MQLRSPDFKPGETIPDRFTQFHENDSPALELSDVPADAQSIVIIMDDPDAPHGLFTHLVAFNMDPSTRTIPSNEFPRGTCFGVNSYGKPEYAGPKPPDGEHRYFFRVYALDTKLDFPTGATRPSIEQAMIGHVLDKAELMGRYTTPVEV